MEKIKTFNIIKNAVWSCSFTDGEIDRADQTVNVVLLRDIMHEIQAYIGFYELTDRLERRVPQTGKVKPAHDFSTQTNNRIQQVLKRFKSVDPSKLRETIGKAHISE